MPKVIDAQALFVATVRVFGERGFLATTTREIAERAGANEVTLFRRYGTKAKLVVAALRHCLADTPLARVGASEDAEADLLAIASAYLATNDAYGAAVFTLLDELALYPELRGAISVLERNLGNVTKIIAGHQAAGRLTAGDPREKLVFLMAPLMASGIWQRAKMGLAPRLTPEGVVAAFLNGHGRLST